MDGLTSQCLWLSVVMQVVAVASMHAGRLRPQNHFLSSELAFFGAFGLITFSTLLMLFLGNGYWIIFGAVISLLGIGGNWAVPTAEARPAT